MIVKSIVILEQEIRCDYPDCESACKVVFGPSVFGGTFSEELRESCARTAEQNPDWHYEPMKGIYCEKHKAMWIK